MKQKALRTVIFLAILITLDWMVSVFFQKGLEHYYGLDQEADILIIGHSHLMKTCNKNKMEKELGLKISKYCREGVEKCKNKSNAQKSPKKSPKEPKLP